MSASADRPQAVPELNHDKNNVVRSDSDPSASSEPSSTFDNGDSQAGYGSGDAEHDHLLNEVIFPTDAYLNGTYWADLPARESMRWQNAQFFGESWREIKHIGAMFKRDPLSPITAYFHNYVITGMGLFVEGYTLFSVGNLTSLFGSVWPSCWKTSTICNKNWIASLTYLEVVGIIFGQVFVGVIGDWLGRRWGMVQDALVMTLGTIMLTAMWGNSLNGWVICYAWSLFVYGIGVGGEYPMTSTRAMEGGSGRNSSTGDKLHRGRKVNLSFLMQGWGQFADQAVLTILLLIFNGGSSAPYSEATAQWTFRIQFAIIAVLTLWLAYYRFYRMTYADTSLRASKAKSNVTGYDTESLRLVTTHYWHRLIGTAGCWFCNDVSFYGAKLFQSRFLSVILGGSVPLIQSWNYNLINIGVALVGYYLAALFTDYKPLGRMRLQLLGFTMDFVLFLIAAAIYPTLIEPAHIHAFQAIYFLSGFFQQFGPNQTTFLLAAEVYPAPIRSTAHGLSAAAGKVGALVPAVAYNYMTSGDGGGDRDKFWLVTFFGLLGMILTFVFVPDTTGLDLREQERYWLYVKQGRPQDYHGISIHPRHLSIFERFVLRANRHYDPELDRQAKIQELKMVWERGLKNQAVKDEKTKPEEDLDDEEQSYVTEKVQEYFRRQQGSQGKGLVSLEKQDL